MVFIGVSLYCMKAREGLFLAQPHFASRPPSRRVYPERYRIIHMGGHSRPPPLREE